MSDESMEIPFEADLAPLQAAIDRVVAAIDKMAATITSAFDRANTSINASVSKMNAFQTGTSSAAAASHQMSQATAGMSAKIMQAASAAGTLGHAAAGIKEGLSAASSAARYLRNTNLGSTLTGWITRAGGIRSAFRQIPAAMSAIASNPVFRRVAAGAVIAVGGILAIRTAWRTVTGAFSLARNTITASFRGIVTAARSAAAQAGNAFKGLASMPGKLLGGGLPVAGILGGLGGLGLGALIAQGGMLAGSFEQTEMAMQALTGTGAAANAMMQGMKKTWMETGVAVSQQAGTIQKFLALGFSSDSATKLQKNILDIAGGIGMTAENAELLGSALAQVKAKGVVSMEELRGQIAEKGVPVFKALADSMGVSQAALMKLVGEGKVPAENLLNIFMNMSGEFAKFAGGANRLGTSFMGQINRMKASFQLAFASFAEPIIMGLKPILELVITKMNGLQSVASSAGEKIRRALDLGVAAWQTGLIAETVGTGLQVAIIRGLNLFSSEVRKIMAYMGAAMESIMKSLRISWGAQELIGIFADLGKGLASAITAGILRGIDKIPGVDTTQDAKREERGAANSFNRAKNRLEDINLGTALQEVIDALNQAHDKGMEAAAKAVATPWINGTKAEDDLKTLKSKLEEQMKINQDAANALNKALDQNNQASPNGGFNGAPAEIQKAVAKSQPQFTSLGRIGGGGFSSMSPMISEQKRTNGILGQIKEQIIRTGNKSTPVIA